MKTITNGKLEKVQMILDSIDINNQSNTNQKVIQMSDTLGIEPMFRSFEEFDSFMKSDKPLVLKF